MRLFALSFAGVLVVASPGISCESLHAFADQGEAPVVAGREAACTTSRVLGGGSSQDCFYRFEFRSNGAQSNFQLLAQQLSQCTEGEAKTEGATVNHPDSYDQIIAPVVGRFLSLSLKDKGALGETLIVLRRTLP